MSVLLTLFAVIPVLYRARRGYVWSYNRVGFEVEAVSYYRFFARIVSLREPYRSNVVAVAVDVNVFTAVRVFGNLFNNVNFRAVLQGLFCGNVAFAVENGKAHVAVLFGILRRAVFRVTAEYFGIASAVCAIIELDVLVRACNRFEVVGRVGVSSVR